MVVRAHNRYISRIQQQQQTHTYHRTDEEDNMLFAQNNEYIYIYIYYTTTTEQPYTNETLQNRFVLVAATLFLRRCVSPGIMIVPVSK